MHRIMPAGWEFLDHARTFVTERLPAPISPNPAQWFWEAARVFDHEGSWLETPEGVCGYELMTDPVDLLRYLEGLELHDISIIPVYGEIQSERFLAKAAEEWDVWSDEWEDEEEEEED